MRAEKKMILYISNEDMNDIIKIIKSLQDSNVFIDRIPETVKHKTKKPKRWISSCFVSASLVASLVQIVISSVVIGVSGRKVRRAGREYLDKKF